MFKRFSIPVLFLIACLWLPVGAVEQVVLSKSGKANYKIVSPANASECELFAAQELKKFLFQISKAEFQIVPATKRKAIVVSALNALKKYDQSLKDIVLAEEAYQIFRRKDQIYLVGGSPRSTLYAVYDFLNQLGCHWVAPDYSFYVGTDRNIPVQSELKFDLAKEQLEKPVFKYRKFYVEEGRSHTLESLMQLVDWMPKLRMNTLVFPMDYEGRGEVKWDNWRDQLIPELRKRDMLIEVGGHGYQNFIHATMEDGKLYDQHPEWFGVDDTGVRSKNPHMVLCTSNPDAVKYMYGHVFSYLKSRPEIDIFDFWPPDSERWCRCEHCLALGSETERHVLLVNQVADLLQKDLPEVQLECLAYNRYTTPTLDLTLNKNVLLDFCPIGQNFEYQIYEKGNARNEGYNKDLIAWLKVFQGDISVYSYFRKYAWRSLPNIIPHYMQNDLKYYQKLGVQGISVYSEPGDWFTFGVNHYVFTHLAWNPDIPVNDLIARYAQVLYGESASTVIAVYQELEDIVRFACNIAHTKIKSPEQYDQYLNRVKACRNQVKLSLKKESLDSPFQQNLERLDLMLVYAMKSIHLMRFKALNNKEQTDQSDADIRLFLREHAKQGIFIPHKQL